MSLAIRFELRIVLGNDAMLTRNDLEFALRDVADEIKEGAIASPIIDKNGNSVGYYKMEVVNG